MNPSNMVKQEALEENSFISIMDLLAFTNRTLPKCSKDTNLILSLTH